MLIGFIANLSVLGPAMGMGYSAIALPPLTSPTSELKMTQNQAYWIASSAAVSVPAGCLTSSFLMRRGRVPTLLTTSIVSLAGWLLIYFSANYEQIVIGRILSGVAIGLASTPTTVYAAEIASPKLRSTMVTWTSVAIAIGILVVYTVGFIFEDNWRMVALICGIFPFLAIVLLLALVPESPIWLRDRGRLDEAIEVMKKFRGTPKGKPATAEILEELDVMRRNKELKWKHIFRRSSLMPFFVMLSYFFFQQFSGIFVVVYYAVDIAKEAGVVADGYLVAVLIGITRLLAVLLVCFASRKFGRRKPSILSGAGMTIFMGLLSIYVLLLDKGYNINDGGFLPIFCLLGYIFASTLGFLVIPFAMVGEIFPSNVKDILSGVTTALAYVFSFFTVFIYPYSLETMGKHGVFFFYAAMSLLGTVFVFTLLPETRGKTLSEIEELFVKRNKDAEEPEKKVFTLRSVTAES
ncbi:facilitated trehalose transporter Tret1-2 homolog isoform X2 [Orussus abietinus]|nr:facilitated trehalose transporter Tret1-2 homolog isoform X2 [Orussus abietinus]XP_012270219.1 facilitated trehalose transporter Tret1-2 homolog isoform X2 [Orussus abietinus]